MTIPFSPRIRTLSGAFVTTALCAGLLLSAGCSKSPAQIEKKDLGLGEHYLSEGKVNEAIIEFQNVLKVNPKSVKGRVGLATAYLTKGWTSEAVLEFQEVAKEDPLSLDAHLALARYGVNSGQWTAVEPEIGAVLKIDPNNVEGLTFEGERNLALGHEKEAEDSFKKALALSPGAVPALVGMGDLYRHENQPDKASSFYQQALGKDPKNGRALTGLGFLAKSRGKTDEAKEDFRKAMEADKADLRSRIIYANFLAGQGHVHQAIVLLKAVPQKAADLRIPVKIAEYEVLLGENAQAIALMHPFDLQKIPLPDIYLVLAKAYQGSRRMPEALDEAMKLSTMEGVPPVMKIAAAQVELAGRNPEKAKEILDSIKDVAHLPVAYWLTRGQVDLARNLNDRAQSVFEEGVARFPGDTSLLMVLADTELVRKQYGKARKTLDGLLSGDPENPNIIGKIGLVIARSQGVPAEIAYYGKMAKTYPDSEGLESLYLLSLASSKKLSQAIIAGETYLKAHPAMQNLRALVGSFEIQSGNREKGIALYKEILASDPKNLQALSALANLEYQDRHYAQAESLFRRVLRIVPQNPDFETSLGEVLLAENQKEAALVLFRKALDANPNQILALFELGRSEVFAGDGREALTHLAPLVKLRFSAGRRAEIQWLWGLANEISGKGDVAADALGQAVRLDPKSAVYHESLGNFWMDRSRWNKALPELEKGLALDPKNALLALQVDWGKLFKNSKGAPDPSRLKQIAGKAASFGKSHPGDLYSGLIEASADRLLKKNNRALGVYDRLLSAHPGERSVLLGKANILLEEGHDRQAKKIAKGLLTANPEDIEGNLLMAALDGKAHDLKGLADHLQKVHQRLPKAVGPALGLASADLSLKRFEEAKSVAFSLYEAHPGFYQALYVQASAEMGLGEYQNAVRDYRILADHSKKPAPFLNMASVAAGKMGDSREAKRYLDRAFQSDANNPGVLNNMAFYLADRNIDLPRALAYAKKALGTGAAPEVQDTVGYVLFRMGRYDRAESHFAAAYKENFRDPEFLYHMGLNESAMGKKSRAQELLEKAISSGQLSPEERMEAHRVLGKLS